MYSKIIVSSAHRAYPICSILHLTTQMGGGAFENPGRVRGLMAVLVRVGWGLLEGGLGLGQRGGRWSLEGTALRIRSPMQSWLLPPPEKPDLKVSILCAHPASPLRPFAGSDRSWCGRRPPG